eukprot:366516-Chlamydomonas_euryale.AAC.5
MAEHSPHQSVFPTFAPPIPPPAAYLGHPAGDHGGARVVVRSSDHVQAARDTRNGLQGQRQGVEGWKCGRSLATWH